MRDRAIKMLRPNIVLVLLILALGAATHLTALNAPFKTLDDRNSIIENPHIRSFANAGKIFTLSFFGDNHYYRPMVTLSFMTEYRFFGLNPFYYNLTNLGLHLATSVTVYFLILMVFSRGVAFFTALLFAVHPVQWEAVANIPGRAILLSAFFTVSAFFFYRAGQGKKNFWVYFAASVASFTAGLFSKESAAMLPLLVGAHMVFIERNPRKLLWLSGYFLIIAGYLTLRHCLGIMETYPWRTPQEYALGFVTFLRSTLTHLRIIVWPSGLHFDRAQKMFLSFADPGVFETLLAFPLMGVGLYTARKWLTREIWFFIFWFCIELLPVSQIVTTIGVGPGYISAADHFLYAASIGLFAAMSAAGRDLYVLNARARIFSPAFVRALTAGAFMSLMLVTVYQEVLALNTLSMFYRTLEHNPNNARILFSTGRELVEQRRFREALQYFQRALALDPANVAYRIGYGRALFDTGRVLESLNVYESVRDPGKLTELWRKNLDQAYQAVLAKYRQSIADDPNDPQGYYSLGTLYSRQGNLQAGVAEYLKAVALKPDHKNALFNLASSYEALGRIDESIDYFQRVFALPGPKDHFDVYACERLAKMYSGRGQEGLAQPWRQAAQRLPRALKGHADQPVPSAP